MAEALKEAFWGAGRVGPQLPSEQQTTFRQTVGYTGPGDIYTRKEYKQGAKKYKKSGNQFGDYLSALAGSVAASDIDPKLKKGLEKKGYREFEGYYTQKAPVTAASISSLASRGFASGDVQKFLADTFKNEYLGSEVGKFFGPDYVLSPTSGKWERQEKTIDITPPTTPSGIDTSISGTITKASGIYAGLDPDTMKGYNPSEIEYAAAIDPYKIQAKSAERISRVGQGTALYSLIGNVI